jgi:hypothetical protein
MPKVPDLCTHAEPSDVSGGVWSKRRRTDREPPVTSHRTGTLPQFNR